jgi:hypothetical protein
MLKYTLNTLILKDIIGLLLIIKLRGGFSRFFFALVENMGGVGKSLLQRRIPAPPSKAATPPKILGENVFRNAP